jgi:hypothetical protein
MDAIHKVQTAYLICHSGDPAREETIATGLAAFGIPVVRLPVSGTSVSPRQIQLRKIDAIQAARKEGHAAIWVIEDTAVLHPNFRALIGIVAPPSNWGVLHLGGTHMKRPAWAGNRVVEVASLTGSPAFIVRDTHYAEMLRTLATLADDGLEPLADWNGGESPVHAIHPNLAWIPTTVDESEVYDREGNQLRWSSTTAGLIDEAVRDAEPPARSKLGLLFLTHGDVVHPEIWREFVSERPERVKILSHPKAPAQTDGGFLEGSAIEHLIETKWGDISLVQAARNLLLEALRDTELTHFVLLSETCVPLRPLPEILRRLDLDPRSQFRFLHIGETWELLQERAAMLPEIPLGCWRFTSQWWLLNRTAATLAAGQDQTELFARMEVPDECYFATVLALQGYPLEREVINQPVTWSWWEADRGSPLPWVDFPPDRFRSAFHSPALFGRKFLEGSNIGSFGLHRSPG